MCVQLHTILVCNGMIIDLCNSTQILYIVQARRLGGSEVRTNCSQKLLPRLQLLSYTAAQSERQIRLHGNC